MPAPDSDAGQQSTGSTGPSTAALSARLSAVERALDPTESVNDSQEETAPLDERLCAVEEDLAALSDRLTEVEAATQAVRGYVGSIRATNERVRRRADRALAATEALRAEDSSESWASSFGSDAPSSSSLSAARDGPQGSDATDLSEDVDGDGGETADSNGSAGDRPFLDRLGNVL